MLARSHDNIRGQVLRWIAALGPASAASVGLLAFSPIPASASSALLTHQVAASRPRPIIPAPRPTEGSLGAPFNMGLGNNTAVVWNHGTFILKAHAIITYKDGGSSVVMDIPYRNCAVGQCNDVLHRQDCCLFKNPGEIDGIPDNAEVRTYMHAAFGSEIGKGEQYVLTTPRKTCINVWGSLYINSWTGC